MTATAGLDRAVEYVQKIEAFRKAFGATLPNGDTAEIENGRKFDKVYVQTYHNGKPNQRLGRYFVDRNSWIIYGIKSWQQVNERRQFGTLDTVDQYDWSPYHAIPKVGTDAEKLYEAREAEIARTHKPRGRPRKNTPKP